MKKKEIKEIKLKNKKKGLDNYVSEEDKRMVDLKYPKIREQMLMKFAKNNIRIEDPHVITFFAEQE